MSRPVFFRVKDIWDLIEHAKRCPEVIYYQYETYKDSYKAMIIAGRYLWIGKIKNNSREEEAITNLLQEKGIVISEILTPEKLLEMI